MVFVSLTAYILMASSQLPTTWTNLYYFFSNINTPLIVAHQKILDEETAINLKTFTNYDDHSIQNTLSSHVVLLVTCLRDLKHTKDDLAKTHTTVDKVKHELKGTKANLANTHTVVENVKKRLANVIATVENMKKDTNVNVASSIVDNVYCDFTKPVNDTGFQQVIGHVDVKTSSVYFHAIRSSSYSTLNVAIPFDFLRLNLGNAKSTNFCGA